MKKSTNIILAVVIVLFCLSLNVQGQNNQKYVSLSQLKWEVTPSKDSYIPLEPIQINFRLTNETQKATRNEEVFTITVEIVHDGETNRKPQLFGGTEKRISIYNGVKAGETVEKSILLDFNLAKLFPEYGTYILKFFIQIGTLENEGLEFAVEPFTLTIREPVGVDKEAYDYIINYYKSPPVSLLSFIDYEKGTKILGGFIDRYSTSVYGDYAIFNLAKLRFYNKQYTLAEELFTLLKDRENFVLLPQVKDFLYQTNEKLRSRNTNSKKSKN